MGTPVPPDMPVLEDDKIYRVGVDWYQDVTPATGCDQKYQGREQCCWDGGTIKAWRDGGGECVAGDELCMITGFSAQRLVFIHGPYDDIGACLADI